MRVYPGVVLKQIFPPGKFYGATRRQVETPALFASDRSPGFGNESPKDAWEAFRHLPLSEKEFKTVADNVAPDMR